MIPIILLFYLCASVMSQCTRPRIRKSWYVLTENEKQLYLDAIELAMDRGYHALFIEVHSHPQSDQESHYTCGFLIWHRRFILAYENMLRSLGQRYQCITLPYWDYFADYEKMRRGECFSLESCSPFLQEMGGSNGTYSTSVINGFLIPGNCVTKRPGNHFCQSSSISSGMCQRCIPRGNWTQTPYPAEASLIQVVSALSTRTGYLDFNRAIQENIHNQIHNEAAATMSTVVSVSDPIFFSHHSTIDLLYKLFYDCKTGQKAHFGFQNCPLTTHPEAGVIQGPQRQSVIQMHWAVLGTPETESTSADAHPTIGRFFSSIGTRYNDLVDAQTLGYDYESDSLLDQLKNSRFVCTSQNTETTTPVPTTQERDWFTFDWRKLTSTSNNWIEETLEAILPRVQTKKEAIEQLEIMECLNQYEKTNKTLHDYSDVFRSQFHIAPSKHSRCTQILLQLVNGSLQLRIKDYRKFYATGR